MAFSWLLAYLGKAGCHTRKTFIIFIARELRRTHRCERRGANDPTGRNSLISTLPSAPPGPGEGWVLGEPWRGLVAARGPNTGENPRVNDSVYNTRRHGEE